MCENLDTRFAGADQTTWTAPQTPLYYAANDVWAKVGHDGELLRCAFSADEVRKGRLAGWLVVRRAGCQHDTCAPLVSVKA
jgi:hypothetical protein